jgi:hypothetical protein
VASADKKPVPVLAADPRVEVGAIATRWGVLVTLAHLRVRNRYRAMACWTVN